MKDNTKAIVIAMNEGEAREYAQYHKTMNREDACYVKTLELEHRRITFTEKTSRGTKVHKSWTLFNKSIFATLMFY